MNVPHGDEGYGVAVRDTNGDGAADEIFVVGTRVGIEVWDGFIWQGVTNWAILKVDASGGEVWNKSVDSGDIALGPGATRVVDAWDYARHAAIDNSGNVVASGSFVYDYGTHGADSMWMRYDSSGNPVATWGNDLANRPGTFLYDFGNGNGRHDHAVAAVFDSDGGSWKRTDTRLTGMVPVVGRCGALSRGGALAEFVTIAGESW